MAAEAPARPGPAPAPEPLPPAGAGEGRPGEGPGARPRLLVVGPLPPPLTGAGKNTLRLAAEAEAAGLEVHRFGTVPPGTRPHARGPAHLLARARHGLALARRLRRTARPGDTLLLVPDGGAGLALNLLMAAALLGRSPGRILLQHRTGATLRRRHPLLALLLRLLALAGRETVQVFLDGEMADAFARAYGAPGRCLVLSNAAACDVDPDDGAAPPGGPRRAGPPVIGFLGTLAAEKGFDTAADAFARLAAAPGLRFAVAGEAAEPGAAARLAALRAALGDRLAVAGAVTGAAKAAFLRGLDILVMPTRWRLEAQPNVVWEAMAAGVTVVATAHAGIPAMLAGAPHRLVPAGTRDAALLARVLREEAAAMADPAVRAARAAAAVAAFRRARAAAAPAKAALARLLAAPPPPPRPRPRPGRLCARALQLLLHRAACRLRRAWLGLAWEIGPGTVIAGPVHRRAFAGEVRIGAGAWLGPDLTIDAARGAEIRIGDHVSLNRGTVLAARARIVIGEGCRIGDHVSIRDSDHAFDDPGLPLRLQGFRTRPVTVGRDVWIGRGTTLMPGVTVGDGAVIGAMSLVRGDVAPGAVVAGIPARTIGRRGGAGERAA